MDWLSSELNMRQLDHWYRMSEDHIKMAVPLTSIRKHGLIHLLTIAYPNHQWDVHKLASTTTKSRKAGQAMLLRTLSQLFPGIGTKPFANLPSNSKKTYLRNDPL